MPPWKTLSVAILLATQLWGESGIAPAQEDANPWDRVVELRTSVIRVGPQAWPFTQTFRPAGFSEGDAETGQLSLDLPLCARWDYDKPYPKSFLLCGRELYTWNPGEPIGHIFAVDASQPGIDLIRLDAEQLAERYHAEKVGMDTLRLTPLRQDHRLLSEAELTFANDPPHLSRLTYRDAEGSVTTFDFSTPARLDDRSPFDPPERVSWEIEGDG
ncbi:MAG: outer membrane lipoprotein carrier protein LolA [Thermoanaerobaculia bacterium]|nr:outer membrane lipoprotein carrier protein LolA [Thermoanaerobaculia bacterium]